MKWISTLMIAATLSAPMISSAQDAATEERLNKLAAQLQDLTERQAAQDKNIEALTRELRGIEQAQQNKPAVEYAAQDDLKQLAAKVQDVDRKRQDDNERILGVLKSLGKNLGATSGKKPAATPKVSDEPAPKGPASSEVGFEHEVKAGQTLSAIVQAYRDEKKTKATLKQVLDANPGLKPEKMYVGQKIFIPAPQQ